MRRLCLFAVAGLALAVALASAGTSRSQLDYAAVALNVLPPGENGSLIFDRHTTDQVALYDCLTPLFDRVRAADLRRCFKPASLGMPTKPARVERPRKGVLVARDAWGVPHVSGATRTDVAFGAGWVTAEDRGLLLELLRGPARAAALDIPGVSPIGLALSGKTLVPSPQAEAFIASQLPLLRASGALGRQLLKVLGSYAAGLNAYLSANSLASTPYTTNDLIAIAALLTAGFGANGGLEVQDSMLLDALRTRLGEDKGTQVFDDLRELNDPETPVTVPGRYPLGLPAPAQVAGSVVVDDGTFEPLGPNGSPILPSRRAASNALLVGAKRSKTGHPLFVAGPQVGYFFPEFFMEVDLQGGGFNARGALLPGLPLVLIGRGPDLVWSATSSRSDNQDVFAETLCGDDLRYLYRGQCRAMTTLDAGTLRSAGGPDQRLMLRLTVHGVVQGYATVKGRRVALSLERSTRGREVVSGLPLYALDTGRVRSAQDFIKTMSGVEAMFNFFYADDRDIAYYSAGRLPIRAPGTEPSLPTVGTGDFDWRGFVPAKGHPQAVDPPGGVILNWNNKPAAGVAGSDDNWSYGSVQRVDLLTAALGSGKHDLASVVAAANKAATQDLRVMHVWPTIEAVLKTGPAPSPLAQQAAALLDAWRAKGGSRLDKDLDGKIDDPGAAVMDAAWPRLARAVLSPVLGPLVERLAKLRVVSDDPSPQGSAYLDGWYGRVDKDLRTLLGRPVKGAFHVRYCGGGDLAACRASLWAALVAAAAELAGKQGADPGQWRSDATAERIDFTTGILRETMRWANRPTFQQVMTFRGHRPR